MTPNPEKKVAPPDTVRPARSGGAGTYRFALGAMLVVASIVVGSLLIDTRDKLAELASSPQDNVQWTLSQFEVEFLALAVATLEAKESHVAGRPVDLTDLRRRYDILYARSQILIKGEVYRQAFASADLNSDVAAIAEQIVALAPVIDASDEILIKALPQIHTQLTELRDETRAIMTEGNRALAYFSDTNRQEISAVLFRLALATGFLLIILATLAILFRRMAGISENRLRDNLTTSARLEAIFQTSRDAIVVVEADGTIVNINRAGELLFGQSGAYLRGTRIGALLSRDTESGPADVTGPVLFGLARSDRTTAIRLTGHKHDGTDLPVEISVNVSMQDRRPICVAVIRDIAHQAAVEEELMQSRDDALAGERAKARFLGVVSHEMRTPLNGIIGTLDLIEEDRIRDGARPDALSDTYLSVLRSSSRTLLTLVNDVLDITQIDAGIRLHTRAFDFDRMVSDLVMAETAQAKAGGNQVSIVNVAPIGSVMGDPDRLRQVIANILGNAIKFTSDGTITIETSRLPDGEVEIQIADTGFGMTDDELDRVFDDFVRTDQAISGQIQGTGLGLGIARALVEAMQGKIGAESVPGEGSLFWIRLPLLPAKGDRRPRLPLDHATRAKPANILLVEDNATNRFIARRLIENDGHSVTEATDGAEAVERAATSPFDIIFMDISMPVMDGMSAARIIRNSDGPNRHTPIVALTAHVSGGMDEAATREVMDAVLHKPLNRHDLRSEIARATGAVKVTGADGEADVTTPLQGIDPAMVDRLTRTFLKDTDRAVLEINAFLQSPDVERVPLAAALHDLAGACASFGATEMHRLLITAESAARAGDRDEAETLTRRVFALWPEIRAQLSREKQKPSDETARHSTQKG